MSDMFEKKGTQKKIEEEEQRARQINQEPADTEYNEAQDERAERLRDMMQSRSRWDTRGLKPNTRRKKIGITLLIAGLVGYLLIQYVLKGG